MPQPDYTISYQPLFTALQTIDVQALIEQVVRLGVMQGE